MKNLITALMVITAVLFNGIGYAGEGKVYHVVLVKLKDGVTSEQIEEMCTVCKALLSQIPGVLDVSMGKKALDNRAIHIKEYDVALYVKWESIETGKVYGPHILHQSFLKLYKPMFAELKLMDFYGE